MFQDQAWFDESPEALVMFVPGGHYTDEWELAAELLHVVSALRDALAGDG